MPGHHSPHGTTTEVIIVLFIVTESQLTGAAQPSPFLVYQPPLDPPPAPVPMRRETNASALAFPRVDNLSWVRTDADELHIWW